MRTVVEGAVERACARVLGHPFVPIDEALGLVRVLSADGLREVSEGAFPVVEVKCARLVIFEHPREDWVPVNERGEKERVGGGDQLWRRGGASSWGLRPLREGWGQSQEQTWG